MSAPRSGWVTAAGVGTRMRTRINLVASLRAEAARSDSQVGITLAGAVAAVGFLATTWPPDRLPTAAAVLWWLGMAAAATGIAALGRSLRPSIPRDGGVPVAAWHCWDVTRAARAGELTAVLDRTDSDIDAADRQTEHLAVAVEAKWAWNRRGLHALGVALAVFAVTGIAGQVAG